MEQQTRREQLSHRVESLASQVEHVQSVRQSILSELPAWGQETAETIPDGPCLEGLPGQWNTLNTSVLSVCHAIKTSQKLREEKSAGVEAFLVGHPEISREYLGKLAGLEVALVNTMSREKVMKQVLESAKREYDYILIDCTPSLGMLTVNALAAADSALIPVQAQYLSAKGLEQLLQTVQKVRRQINPKLKIEGILLTMTDSRTIYGQQISNLIRQAYGKHLKVFDQTIPRSVRAAETSTTGKSIFQYDPKGKVAEAYHSIAKGVLADAEKRLKRQFEQLR